MRRTEVVVELSVTLHMPIEVAPDRTLAELKDELTKIVRERLDMFVQDWGGGISRCSEPEVTQIVFSEEKR